MDGQKAPNASGMINGGLLALFIIGGGIVGDVVLYQPATNYGFGIIAIVLGLLLFGVSIFMLFRAKELSALTYLFTIISCVSFPLFGGIAAYSVLKRKGWTQ